MAQQTKQDLLSSAEAEFRKLRKALDGVDADLASKPHPEDGISIKDTILHRAHWVELFLGWYRDGVAGRIVHTPARGFKWNQLKEYNAQLREQTRTVPWSDALANLDAAHAQLMGLIESLDETELYGPRKYEWTNNWKVGRWAEASGPSHYRSAAKYIRSVRRRLTAAT